MVKPVLHVNLKVHANFLNINKTQVKILPSKLQIC